MPNAGEVLKKFYAAVIKRDLDLARSYLDDKLIFAGLFETYHNAEEYITALSGLLQVTVRLEIKTIIAEGNEAAVFLRVRDQGPS